MGRPRKPHLPKNCEMCGKLIVPRIYYRKDGGIHHIFMPTKYCSLSCAGKAAHETQFKKRRGWSFDKSGYIMLGRKQGERYQQPEHRAVMEMLIGRKLENHETVHHKNGVRHDNRPENLELWSSRHGRGHRVDDEALDIWSGTIPKYQFNALQEEST